MIIETYKDYEITQESYGFVVCYCGDEVVHNTVQEARAFIDDITE